MLREAEGTEGIGQLMAKGAKQIETDIVGGVQVVAVLNHLDEQVLNRIAHQFLIASHTDTI